MRVTRYLLNLALQARSGSCICPGCLQDLAIEINDQPGGHLDEAARQLRDYPAVWTTSLRQLILLWRGNDLDHARRHLLSVVNSCVHAHGEVNAHAHNITDKHACNLVSMLVLMLNQGKHAPARTLKRGAPLDETRWPSSQQDLEIFLENYTIDILLFSATRTGSTVIIELFNIIISLPAHGKRFVATLLRRHRLVILWVAVAAIVSIVPQISAPSILGFIPDSASDFHDQENTNEPSSVLHGVRLLQLGLDRTNTFEALGRIHELVQDFEQPTLVAVMSAAEHLPPTHEALVPIGELAALLNNVDQPRRPFPTLSAAERLNLLKTSWAPALWKHLRDGISKRRCFSGVCVDFVDGSSNKLQACARCAFTRYCCIPCQKADWKYGRTIEVATMSLGQVTRPRIHGTCTHKLMCPLLTSAMNAYRQSDNEAEFVAQAENVGFSLEDHGLLMLWLVSIGALDQETAGWLLAIVRRAGLVCIGFTDHYARHFRDQRT